MTYPGAETTLPVVREDLFLPAALLRDVGASARPHRLTFPDGHRGWLVSDYAASRALLADRRFMIGVSRQPRGQPGKFTAFHDALGPLGAGSITSLDPPGHTRLRRAVGDHFRPANVAKRTEGIERIVADQIDTLVEAGRPADLLTAFARPVPSRVICDLLGAPQSDQHHFLPPTELMLSPRGTPDEVKGAFADFSDPVRAVVASKRTQPGDDLLSDMVLGNELVR